jgi:tetratricopeptide (TPR) repeat protein
MVIAPTKEPFMKALSNNMFRECQMSPFRFTCLCLFLCLSAILFGCGHSTGAFLAKGEEYLQKREFADAVTQFRAAAETDKSSAAAQWGLARAYDNLGQFNETLEALRQTVELDSTNLEAKARLGNYFLLSQPPLVPEAEKMRNQIETADPRFVDGKLLSASIMVAQGRTDADIEFTVNQAISFDPQRVRTYIALARFYMSRKRAQDAEASIQKGIAANPTSTVGYVEYGKFFTYTGRDTEADAQFHKAIEIDPSDISARETMADFYVTTSQFDKAKSAYEDLVQLQGNSPSSRLALADFYSRMNHSDEGIGVLRQMLTDTPDYVRARYQLGKIYLDRKDAAGVTEQLDALFKIDDQDVEALKLGSRLKIQQNKADEAVAVLQQILDKYPSEREALFMMAQVRISLGQIEQSRIYITDLERYHPTYLRVELLKIQSAFSEGNWESALKLANQLIDNTTITVQARLDAQALQDLRLRAISSRGLAYLELGKIAEAKMDLQEVIRLSPHSADAVVNLAKVFTREGDLNAALQTYENALAIDTWNFDALSGFVNTNIKLKQTDRAQSKTKEWLAAVADKNDIRAAVHYLRSNIFTAENNPAAAERELQQAIDADDNYLPAYSAYANLLVGQNRSEEAMAQYIRVVQKRPAAQAYTMLGILSDGAGRPAEAEGYYRKALEITPGMPIAANNLAWLLTENNGNLDEALKLAMGATTKSPEIAGYHDTLGQVYLKKQLFFPAIEQFKKAISLDGSNRQRKGSGPAPDYRGRLSMAMAAAGDRAGARTNTDVSTRN